MRWADARRPTAVNVLVLPHAQSCVSGKRLSSERITLEDFAKARTCKVHHVLMFRTIVTALEDCF